ncbi:MAG: glycosyl transferase [Chloroflexi bacterium HGW-Chloroflexi-2]|jgi:glycosyltransferase involved in cell wall biosynthesis|nr:MAG: glycosyl transferase [Chloroflexi bacterium HGW-Chloroflexi-2]
MKKLSVVIPVYNEEKYISTTIQRVLDVKLEEVSIEIVAVDDGSKDRTVEILHDLAAEHPEIKVYQQPVNMGKGATLRRGFQEASGDIILIQDADLEYDPGDYPTLLKPILDDKADVVFGSRFLGGPHRVLYFWHFAGNQFLTLLSNITTNLNLTDMETGYKVFRAEVIKGIPLKSNRFGFEPEVTAKIARRGWRIFETQISYFGRSYAEGKKIGWKDGFQAIYCIIRYWIAD